MKETKNNIELLEVKIKNLTFIVIIGFVVIGLLVIGLYFSNSGSKNSTTTASGSSGSSTEYDTSRLTTITGDEAAALFDKKGTHIIFIGRSTCSVCVQLLPELNKVIDENNIEVNYLAMNTNTFRTDWENVFDKLDLETKVNSNAGTFGELLKEYGYTPMVIIIKDGSQVDGFVGYRDASTIKELIAKYM